MRSSEQQPIAGNECPVSKGSRGVKMTIPYIKKNKRVKIFIFKSGSSSAVSWNSGSIWRTYRRGWSFRNTLYKVDKWGLHAGQPHLQDWTLPSYVTGYPKRTLQINNAGAIWNYISNRKESLLFNRRSAMIQARADIRTNTSPKAVTLKSQSSARVRSLLVLRELFFTHPQQGYNLLLNFTET